MISVIVSLAITIIAGLLILIIGSLRWKVEKVPVQEIEEFIADMKDFSKSLKEACQ